MNNGIETEVKPSLSDEVVNHGAKKRINLSKLENWSKIDDEDLIEEIAIQAKKIEIYREKEKLKFTFGEKAKIEQEKNGEWLIESTLESRGIVPGGQKINLRLGEETFIKVGIKDDALIIYNLYPIKDIEINDKKIKFPSEVYFYPREPEFNSSDDLDKEAKKREANVLVDFIENELTGNRMGAASVLHERIILDGFDSAEDLAALFHELGHANGNHYKVYSKDVRFVSESISKLLPGENINEKDANTLLLIFKEENRASSNAIAMIKDLREKGTDLFPKDPGLIHVNLLLAINMSSYLKSSKDGTNLGKQINNPKRFLKFNSQDKEVI